MGVIERVSWRYSGWYTDVIEGGKGSKGTPV